MHSKGVGWRMNECSEVNSYVGAGEVLFWQVTPEHYCIEFC